VDRSQTNTLLVCVIVRAALKVCIHAMHACLVCMFDIACVCVHACVSALVNDHVRVHAYSMRDREKETSQHAFEHIITAQIVCECDCERRSDSLNKERRRHTKKQKQIEIQREIQKGTERD